MALLTYNEFISNYLGKKTDYDKVYGVQCVDSVKMYLLKCFGIKAGSFGNAHAYFDDFSSIKPLKNNFVKIKNTADFIPKKGDICVWKSALGNGAGHISIASGEGTTSYFYSYDQNWNYKGEGLTKVRHTYKYFAGVLRPKTQIVCANGGLNAYDFLLSKKAVIPNGVAVTLNAYSSKAMKKGTAKYLMDKVTYKEKTYYVADNYLMIK